MTRQHAHRGAPRLHPVTESHAGDPVASWPHASEIRLWGRRFGRHLKPRRLPRDQREETLA